MIFFRDDDINPNSDFDNVDACYKVIKEILPDSQIISGVTIFGKTNTTGSVYPNPPFKNNITKWFYDVDLFILPIDLPDNIIASHGLIHVDHSKIGTDAQEMSILTSCRLLDSKIFIPPFNKFNEDTLQICHDNGIKILLTSEGWKSLEFNKFDKNYDKWYLHSWRYTPEKLREELNAGITAGNSQQLG